MSKIQGNLMLPVIDNLPDGNDLEKAICERIDHTNTVSAIFVRNHGLFAWGDTWDVVNTK